MFYVLTTLVTAARLYYFYCEYHATHEELGEDELIWR